MVEFFEFSLQGWGSGGFQSELGNAQWSLRGV
jgi:hypothetical protein